MDITKLHIGQTLRMQSNSLVKEVEVVVLCKQYVEVAFIEDGERRYIRFAADGRQVRCTGSGLDTWDLGSTSTELEPWELVV